MWRFDALWKSYGNFCHVFSRKKKGGKSWILGKHGVNVGFYKVKPHIFQKFSFFWRFPSKKTWKKCPELLHKASNLHTSTKKTPPSTSKTNFAEDFLAKKWGKKKKGDFWSQIFKTNSTIFIAIAFFFPDTRSCLIIAPSPPPFDKKFLVFTGRGCNY